MISSWRVLFELTAMHTKILRLQRQIIRLQRQIIRLKNSKNKAKIRALKKKIRQISSEKCEAQVRACDEINKTYLLKLELQEAKKLINMARKLIKKASNGVFTLCSNLLHAFNAAIQKRDQGRGANFQQVRATTGFEPGDTESDEG